jgi:hypothetical protein
MNAALTGFNLTIPFYSNATTTTATANQSQQAQNTNSQVQPSQLPYQQMQPSNYMNLQQMQQNQLSNPYMQSSQQNKQNQMVLNLIQRSSNSANPVNLGLNQQQLQPANLIDSLVQNSGPPNATSTPNPIQQQHMVSQDLFANLLLKFDPTGGFFPKKDQLSVIFNNNTNNTNNSNGIGSQSMSNQDQPNKKVC